MAHNPGLVKCNVPLRNIYELVRFASYTGIQKGKRIMTNLNADMIIIRGPMGRDRAAFFLSSDAWEFMRSIGHLTNCHWIKPSGETAQWADFADYDEFLNWTYSEFVK